MSERRPHWDDDLILAVSDQMVKDAYHNEKVYDIIAAVEDWQRSKRVLRERTHYDGCWQVHIECADVLIKKWQAAIKRTLELHGVTHWLSGRMTCNVCRDDDGCEIDWPCPTIRALDGDSDE